MECVGQITLGSDVIITDPSYSVNDVWCQETISQMEPGIYNCYEVYEDGKVKKLSIRHENIDDNSLDYCELEDGIGLDKDIVGIFDLQYLKSNKEKRDKKWRKELKEKTERIIENKSYKEYTESDIFKSFKKRAEKAKRGLEERSTSHPEYIQVLDKLFVYDAREDFEESVILKLPTKFLDSMSKFISDRAKAYEKYLADDCSKKELGEYHVTTVDDKCVVAKAEKKGSPFKCFLGYTVQDTVASIIIELDTNDEKESSFNMENWQISQAGSEDDDYILPHSMNYEDDEDDEIYQDREGSISDLYEQSSNNGTILEDYDDDEDDDMFALSIVEEDDEYDEELLRELEKASLYDNNDFEDEDMMDFLVN